MTYEIGQCASFSKTITNFDMYDYAGITGDFNELHNNEIAAEKSRFKRPVVHGMLVCGLISTVLGTEMPGKGTVYVSQNVKILKPVYVNDTVTAYAEIIELFTESRARLKHGWKIRNM